MQPNDLDVIIIGAGVAGLAALHDLDRAGKRVLVLEARDRIGGRIYTMHDPLSSLPLELGAEFVHGRPAETWDVIHDAGLAVYDGTDASRHMNNGKVERNADAWDMVDSVIEEMRKAAEKSDQSFEAFLAQSGYDDDTRQSARGYVEGFNAADSNVISIRALAQETAAADQIDGDRVFRFAGGYDAVPMHLLKSVPRFEEKLSLNTVVDKIVWRQGFVTVHAGKRVFRAERAVITVPLGVLQAGSIVFVPEPKEMLDAARRLRFGQVFRVVLRFREAFWERKEELKDAGFILSSRPFFPTWWTTLAMRSTILTGWSAGSHADALIGLSREVILDRALESLASITGISENEIREQLVSMYFHDWHADPYARGAYSYVPAGAVSARNQLAVPVEETLFFAGEATDQNGHSATVHGAIASGRRAAGQLLSATAAAGS